MSIKKMDLETLKNILNEVLNRFFSIDSFLIQKNLHENTISHRLAFYLEQTNQFQGYSIDCEYNSFLSDHKKFIGDNKGDQTIEIFNKNGIGNAYGCLTGFSAGDKYLVLTQKNECIICKKESQIYKTSTIEIISSTIRPDIIIHKRGESGDKSNLLVFEIKKNKLSNEDKLKLKGLTSKKLNFQYKYGIGLSNFNYEEKSVNIYIYVIGNDGTTYRYKNGVIEQQ